MTFDWDDDPGYCIFDANNQVLGEIVYFIEEALDNFDSVLIHSVDGISRCTTCLLAYWMYKYKWCVDA